MDFKDVEDVEVMEIDYEKCTEWYEFPTEESATLLYNINDEVVEVEVPSLTFHWFEEVSLKKIKFFTAIHEHGYRLTLPVKTVFLLIL